MNQKEHEKLEKKRVWFWLYVATEVAGLVCALIVAVAVVLGSSSGLMLFTVLAAVMGIYIHVYYVYRLLYLYRETPDRMRWTIFTLIMVACGWLEGNQIVGMLLSLVGFVLAIACLIHDYKLVTDS